MTTVSDVRTDSNMMTMNGPGAALGLGAAPLARQHGAVLRWMSNPAKFKFKLSGPSHVPGGPGPGQAEPGLTQ